MRVTLLESWWQDALWRSTGRPWAQVFRLPLSMVMQGSGKKGRWRETVMRVSTRSRVSPGEASVWGLGEACRGRLRLRVSQAKAWGEAMGLVRLRLGMLRAALPTQRNPAFQRLPSE